jgi:hypothetical protein
LVAESVKCCSEIVISTVEKEAWALLLAMKEARHRSLDVVQFESDS